MPNTLTAEQSPPFRVGQVVNVKPLRGDYPYQNSRLVVTDCYFVGFEHNPHWRVSAKGTGNRDWYRCDAGAYSFTVADPVA